ncbi:MAG: nitrite/sulfite reductase [Chloroflexi bacterium]|nr:nitrite/sulfite reductase [Chloroflexota bacterium]
MTTADRKTNWMPNPDTQSILKVIPEEIAAFEEQVERFRAGEWEENEFMAFRLKQGVYGQRQPDVQMVRIKFPFGGINDLQMDAVGEVVEKFAPLGKGHLTTRENIQIHSVLLQDTPEMMRIIGDVGLSTREACGNTLRNVTGCPLAGVGANEIFDVTPYAAAYARFFLRHELSGIMPRKVKSAFSGCEDDCAITPIHDVGIKAKIKDGVKGFEIVMGGGLSIMPRVAPTLYDFVPADDPKWLRIVEAALRIFNRSNEERRNRMKARIKFLIDRIGIDEFRSQVEEELKGDWAKPEIDLESLMEVEDEEAMVRAKNDPPSGISISEIDGPADFKEWVDTNVEAQRQEGYNLVHVALTRGDIFVAQFSGLASIMRNYAHSRARIDVQQNLVLRWVKTEDVLEVYNALKAIGLNASGKHTITDIVTCPGTDTCKLGITASMGLNQALRETLADYDTSDPLVNEIHIKASGCPNSCGQHHIANIGFHGAVMKGPGGQVPAYEVFLGGQYQNGVKIGERIKARVPAKKAPEVLVAILDFYKSQRRDGETFNSFVERSGSEPFEGIIGEFKDVGPLNRDNISNYMDWERTIIYKMERGEGECAV